MERKRKHDFSDRENAALIAAVAENYSILQQCELKVKSARSQGTRGGPPEPNLPFEESVLAIIQGSKTLVGCVSETERDTYAASTSGTSVRVDTPPLSGTALRKSSELICLEEEDDLDDTVMYHYEVPTDAEPQPDQET